MNVWAIWVSLAAHYAREQAFARQQVPFCVAVETFMSKCFLSHPVRDMYHTLIRLLKVKQEIRARFMIKTKCRKTIYGSTEIRTCIWQKDPNCSSALQEETNRQSLFSESLVNSRALGPRTGPTQPLRLLKFTGTMSQMSGPGSSTLHPTANLSALELLNDP